MTTHVIAPGDSSDALVTGTNPSVNMGAPKWPPSPPGGSARPGKAGAHLDASGCQLTRNPNSFAAFSAVILRTTSSGVPAKMRSRNSLDFGQVDSACGKSLPPEHVLDADLVAQLDAEVVLHELHEHVAAPVVARQESLPRLPSPGEHRPLSLGEVHLLQPVR